MIQTKNMLVTAITATSSVVSVIRSGGTFQATILGTGTILAVVIIQGSLDNTNWIDLGTLNISNTVLTGGLTLINTVWPLYRCIATLTPGVGSITSVTVNMGIES